MPAEFRDEEAAYAYVEAGVWANGADDRGRTDLALLGVSGERLTYRRPRQGVTTYGMSSIARHTIS